MIGLSRNYSMADHLTQPKLILFDAAGTLFGVRGSVGEIYSRLARRYDVLVDAASIQEGFLASFSRQPPLAFPNVESETELRRLEYEWWRQLVRTVFARAWFPRFDEFFAEVFDYFRQPEAWQLYEDVVPTLQALQARGIALAVLSNFDGRLVDLLRAFALEPYFAAVHYSAKLGAAKPEARAFHTVLQYHGVWPDEAWHVGDSAREDVEGAGRAGIKAWLIRRNERGEAGTLTRLDQLIELLGDGEY
jgi:putative hydrolase of the HAD superfamily